jgi:hypothetical protein
MSSTVPCCSAYTFHLVVLAAVDDDQFCISKSLPDDLDLIVIDCAAMKHPFNVATVPPKEFSKNAYLFVNFLLVTKRV